MPPPPLSGPMGQRIKLRLESAAIQFEVPTSWEDLYLYIVQDPRWEWDDAIVRKWRQDISAHFLKCCQGVGYNKKEIDGFTLALEDGLQDIRLDEAADEFGDGVEEDSDEPTVRPSKLVEVHNSLPNPRHPQHDNRPSDIIFAVGSERLKWDGLIVDYIDRPRSRISSKVVIERWEIEFRAYELLDEDDPDLKKIQAIDLTWVLPQGVASKTYSTTFEVVADEEILFDAEFGQNRFETPNKKHTTGHSVSRSLPENKTSPSRQQKHSKPRSQSGPSSSEASNKEEFIREQVVAGLHTWADREWEKKQASRHSLSSCPEDDDESSAPFSQTTTNTSISKESSRKGGRKR